VKTAWYNEKRRRGRKNRRENFTTGPVQEGKLRRKSDAGKKKQTERWAVSLPD